MPFSAAFPEVAMIVGTAKENKAIGCRTGRIPAGFKGLSGRGRRMLP